MAVQQSGKNVRFSFKAQSALGTLATGAGARGLDVRPSQGMGLRFAQAASQLVRRDGMSLKPRQGSRQLPAQYSTELMVDALDEIFEAVSRGTWVAEASITEATASLTSATISDSGATITAGGGSWITAGIRKGMMVKFANMSTAANNGKWFPVLAVTATVITTKAAILTDQGADSAFTLTIARQLLQGDPPTERYFTCEQYNQDIDLALVGQDCKFHALTFSAVPDQPVEIGFEFLGRDGDILASGSSPTFSSPTFPTTRPLYLADGGIYVGGTALVNLTGFKWRLMMPAATVPVLGSRLSPDVFLGNATLDGEFMGTIEDDTYFNYALNETQLAVLLHCAERESDPADFVSFFMGDMGMGDFSMPFGQDGPMVQSFPLVGGKDEGGAASGYAPTQLMISTSAS